MGNVVIWVLFIFALVCLPVSLGLAVFYSLIAIWAIAIKAIATTIALGITAFFSYQIIRSS